MPLMLPVEPPVLAVDPPPLPTLPPPLPARLPAVERSDALARLLMGQIPLREEPESAVAKRSAWLALFMAASCALVTYSEFRAERIRGTSPTGMLTSAFASETDPVPNPDAVPGSAPTFRLPPLPAPALRLPTATPTATARPTGAATATATPAGAATATATEAAPRPSVLAPAAPPRLARLTPAKPMEPPRHEPLPIAPRMVPATVSTVAIAPTPRPAPTPAVAAPTPEPAALLRPAPAATPVEPPAVVTAVVVDEEDDIRSTLTRFRTAYSQLNANAAQEVWPSVDVRALRSAFRGLKSQQLHFDRCQLTVTGARARAACSGRAVYVPGVGDQSPRTSPREWNFELMKARERWTISSARSS